MNFHFPVMPRLFMSLRLEHRTPIVDIMEQTPEPPPGGQWATFLRNHDELTLEMVTDEERDLMLRAYATDLEMRINLGIRRRLAPLLGNDRRKIELLNALLFSLPGTPVIYYGDEIGMGDNVYLGDRNGVRTPMQWSADRNAGFSTANPHRLYMPLITEQGYHYESINVETQAANPASLLSWMRQLIALRKRHRVLGRGSIEFLEPENPHVLAFIRHPTPEMDPAEKPLLCVANLSRLAQQVELDLRDFTGAVPVEVFGQNRFSPVDRPPVLADADAVRVHVVRHGQRPGERRPDRRHRRPAAAGRVVARRAAAAGRAGPQHRPLAAEPALVRRQGRHRARRHDRRHRRAVRRRRPRHRAHVVHRGRRPAVRGAAAARLGRPGVRGRPAEARRAARRCSTTARSSTPWRCRRAPASSPSPRCAGAPGAAATRSPSATRGDPGSPS